MSAYKIQTPGNYPEKSMQKKKSILMPMNMEQFDVHGTEHR
jgi:hypothetical protein